MNKIANQASLEIVPWGNFYLLKKWILVKLQGLQDKYFPVNFVNENPQVPIGLKMSCLVFSDLV